MTFRPLKKKKFASGCVVFLAIVFIMAVIMVVHSANASPVEVRYREGVTQGFLVLRSSDGKKLAQGDLSQVASGSDRLVSRFTFQFKDESLYDETVVFSQKRVFSLVSYQLVQRGPAFPETLNISLNGETGEYTVRRKKPKGDEQVFSGRLGLPSDVYNGMTAMILKNLRDEASETIHQVAFMPEPKIFAVQIVPVGTDTMRAGDITKDAVHYVLTPQLGWFLGVLAHLFGRTPADYHLWIFKEDAPAFVKFEGPLYLEGPVWRIEQVSPRLPTEP
ncbi:MAG: hypothetical protein ACT4OO_01690 [Nitrospiraceae bacterium]